MTLQYAVRKRVIPGKEGIGKHKYTANFKYPICNKEVEINVAFYL